MLSHIKVKVMGNLSLCIDSMFNIHLHDKLKFSSNTKRITDLEINFKI